MATSQSIPETEIADPNFINEAGDVITELLVLTTAGGIKYDLSNFCQGLTLFEDIFSNVLTGNALISDSANIISTLAFQGNEFLTISYRTPSFTEKITKSFYVSKVSDRTFISGDRQQAYLISFISIEGLKDNNIVVSKKYSDTSENIIKKVFTEYLSGRRLLEQSDTTTLTTTYAASSSHATLVVPSWNPLKIINWLANRSFSTAGGAPLYMFFESNKGFYFASIEQLVKSQVDSNKIFAEYVYTPSAAMITSPDSGFKYQKPELAKQYGIVKNIKPFKTLDVLEGQDFGYYASRLFTQDIVLKQYLDIPQNYHTKHQAFSHLEKNKGQLFGRELGTTPDNMRFLRTKHYKVHADAQDPLFEKWALERNSMLYELSSLRIHIEVPGRTDIEIGKVVNFLYPKSSDKPEGVVDERDALDPYLSGLYIITAIRHEFSLNRHIMFLELVKDSYSKPLAR